MKRVSFFDSLRLDLDDAIEQHEELRLWLHKVRLQREARAWLRGGGPEKVAACCMWQLNRHVRGAGRSTAGQIYDLKNHLVRIFYQRGLCASASLQVQKMECWDCNGTGETGWVDSEPCWKCGGTGVYRQHVLFRFVFDVGGKRYVWHQPKSLVTWPVTVAMAGLGAYEAKYAGDTWLDTDQRELYMLALREYLRLRGVPERVLPYLIGLRDALRAEWRESRPARRLRAARDGWRKVKRNARRLAEFLRTGAFPEPDNPGWDESEIPF